MIAKLVNFFFSTISIVTSVLILLNHTSENILFMGFIGTFAIPLFKKLNLGWVLHVGSIATLAAVFIPSTPINCIVSIGLGFSQAYLLGIHALKTYLDIDLNQSKIKCKVEELKTLEKPKLRVHIEAVLIQVEPAQANRVPNFRYPVLLTHTVMTLKYAKEYFSSELYYDSKKLRR